MSNTNLFGKWFGKWFGKCEPGEKTNLEKSEEEFDKLFSDFKHIHVDANLRNANLRNANFRKEK